MCLPVGRTVKLQAMSPLLPRPLIGSTNAKLNAMNIAGVGDFSKRDDGWLASPDVLKGVPLKIESEVISSGLIERAQAICERWGEILDVAMHFIEQQRSEYELSARLFFNPGVFIDSPENWAVYFDSGLDGESVVGVSFNLDEPFELTIGDWSDCWEL